MSAALPRVTGQRGVNVTFRLPAAMVARLDAHAAARGVSRSCLATLVLDTHLALNECLADIARHAPSGDATTRTAEPQPTQPKEQP